MNPVSRYVPVLKGKPREQLVATASAILSGKKTEEYARLMHNQYCIPGDEEANCPTARDLQVIAAWLDTGDSLPKKKQTPQKQYISSTEAYEIVSRTPGAILFLDIRTRAEVTFVGMPTVVDSFEGDQAKSGPFKGQRVVNGWRNAGLPWSYKLEKEKIYSELRAARIFSGD